MSAPSARSSSTSRRASSRVGRVHLVGVLVALAEIAGRADRIAERAVEARGVLGGVGEDARVAGSRLLSSASRIAPMRPSIMSEGATTSAPACGMRQRLLDQRVDGDVVDDVAVFVDQAVLAVGGEGIERDVGDHAELRDRAFSARTARCARPSGFQASRRPATWPPAASPGTARSPECRARRFLGARHQHVDRQALDAGHRAHRLDALARPRARTPARSGRRR